MGIVPIYWGCPHINEFFNMNGIIWCRTRSGLLSAVDMVLSDPEGEYNKRRDAIEENLVKVQKYRRYADYFLETYGDLLEEMGK